MIVRCPTSGGGETLNNFWVDAGGSGGSGRLLVRGYGGSWNPPKVLLSGLNPNVQPSAVTGYGATYFMHTQVVNADGTCNGVSWNGAGWYGLFSGTAITPTDP